MSKIAQVCKFVCVILLGFIVFLNAHVEAKEDQQKLWLDKDGKNYFLMGANLPWYNGYRGLDLSAWQGPQTIKTLARTDKPPYDLQDPPAEIKPGICGFDIQGMELEFADMEKIHVTALRWFFGNDGRAFLQLDKDDNCIGIDEQGLKHVDQILKIASKHHVYLIPVLFDFRVVGGDKHLGVDDKKIGPAHAMLIKDAAKRKVLLEKYVRPLVKRYAKSDSILYWEIMNEAGNVTRGEDSVTGYKTASNLNELAPKKMLTVQELQSFLNETYDCIKSVDSKHKVMASGLARPHQLPLIVGRVKTDLYGAHYNDNGSEFRNVMTVKQIEQAYLAPLKLKLDKPLVMTESSASLARHLDVHVQAAYDGGWAGILPWSYYSMIGYDSLRRYKNVPSSADGRNKKTIEFWKSFYENHKVDCSL